MTIKLFSSNDGVVRLEVSLDQDTAWLTQSQMEELFERDRSVISRHINNVFKEGELPRESNLQKMQIAFSDKPVALYSLDVIISVGYRVKSQRGVQFRQWATSTLKEHLVKGYTLNQQRLKERGIEVERVLDLLSQTLTNQQLVTSQGEAVVKVIHDYARSWSLLQAYDEQSLLSQTSQQDHMQALSMNEVLSAIEELKRELIAKGEATALFGQLRGNGLASALDTIEQGFGGEWFYPNIASRAAHLLYFVIKNHPFADGNKRTGSFLFLWYLRVNEYLLGKTVDTLINENTLVALALLIAESKPEQKDIMIRLTEHFILLKETNE